MALKPESLESKFKPLSLNCDVSGKLTAFYLGGFICRIGINLPIFLIFVSMRCHVIHTGKARTWSVKMCPP